MKIPFILYHGEYRLKSKPVWNAAICFDVLNNYFDLSDKPAEIDFHLSNKQHANSYYICAKRVNDLLYAVIALSNGQEISEHVYSVIFNILKKHPAGCYVSVIA